VQPEPRRYRAFISYSHRDKAITQWLHHALETYRIPKGLIGKETRVGPVPARLTPIFRDRDELPASGDLGRELRAALENSMFLVVICSPASAKSMWVNEEIKSFKKLHGEDRVLALVVGGEPYASNGANPELECFPHSLRYTLGPDGEISDVPAEPIAADAREGADGKRLAKLKLVAGLTGSRLDELVQRETQRRIRRLAMISTGATIGMVFAVGLAVYANSQRLEAVAQRKIAEQESATARAASDYLVETFKLSDPGVDNPREITALTILGRSAERARTELKDQPVVQARLIAALARAYNNLGLSDEAQVALETSLPAIRRIGAEGAEAELVLADTYFRKGLFDRALASVRNAEKSLATSTEGNGKLRGQAAYFEGKIHYGMADYGPAIAAFDRALAIYKTTPDVSGPVLASTWENRGLALSDDGQYEAAEKSLSRALAIGRKANGERHLRTGQLWFSLGMNAYLAGDMKLAEERIGKALDIERQMLDPDNPILADTLSMLGQIYQGEHRLDEASKALRDAIRVYRARYKNGHYVIGIADVYLALIESERGNTKKALAYLDDAQVNYDASYGEIHANHGDLLVNRAIVLARAGRMTEARADCAEGLEILGQTLGKDAPFTRQLAETCAGLKPGKA
jgi:tetratricopeptide (TPR) repeat protein